MSADPTALNRWSELASAPAARSASSPSRIETEVGQLFDQYREQLLRYLLSLGLPVSDGEEVVQEVFLALFQSLRRGMSRENLRGWLFRVAHHLALKRRSRMRRDSEALNEAEAGSRIADPSPSPEDRVARHQTQERVFAVVQALPEQDRRCLALRAAGLRYREIAEVLDMSLGAVSLSLARSLARIARSARR